ncbi:MAG: DUF4418 family protein [Spirochaetia bacterium]|jgi:hypothetical protein|nr:DUF4418 family protein [Spirochaetia bacterium]
MKKRLIFGIPQIAIGLLIAVGPAALFPVCETAHGAHGVHGMMMKCHWTMRAELGIGLVIAVLGILNILFSSGRVRLGLSLSLLLNGFLLLLVPTALIGVCGGHMACHTLTMPALSVLSVISIAVSAINAILLFRNLKNET